MLSSYHSNTVLHHSKIRFIKEKSRDMKKYIMNIKLFFFNIYGYICSAPIIRTEHCAASFENSFHRGEE